MSCCRWGERAPNEIGHGLPSHHWLRVGSQTHSLSLAPALAVPGGSSLLSRKGLTLITRYACLTLDAVLLTISTTHQPASDVGFLLHKNPGRLQSFTLPFGRAGVFYPEAERDRCTVALLLAIDPVGLVRPKSGASNSGGWLEQYVNDRPYVASSHLNVAIASVFGSALAGTSKERPDLAESAIPLEARIAAVPSREGADIIRKMFEPLGYAAVIQGHPLDARFPEFVGPAGNDNEDEYPVQPNLSIKV